MSEPTIEPKRPYQTPVLTTYGTLEELTKAGGNDTADAQDASGIRA